LSGKALPALLAAAAAALALSAGATAQEQPVRLAAHCATDSSVCYGVFRQRGNVLFDIDLLGPSFPSYRLCVDPPRGATTCHTYPIRRRERKDYTQYSSEIRMAGSFPARGKGAYKVTWSARGHTLGPALAFRL
jgi:hypothetical protein